MNNKEKYDLVVYFMDCVLSNDSLELDRFGVHFTTNGIEICYLELLDLKGWSAESYCMSSHIDIVEFLCQINNHLLEEKYYE